MSSDLRPKARLKTSLKWTPFPPEFLTQIQQVFEQNFAPQVAEHAPGAKFITEGWIYPQELTLRLGLLEKGRLAQANFEVSANYDSKEEKFIDHIYRCVDLAGTLMDEYLSSGQEMELPREWMKTDFDGGVLWFQFSTVNSDLEAQANALLGENPGLITEIEEDEVPDEDPEETLKKKLH